MSAVAAPCCAVFGVLGVPSTVSRDSICATCKGGLLKSPSFRNEEGERLKADLAAIIRSHAFVRGADYRNLPRTAGGHSCASRSVNFYLLPLLRASHCRSHPATIRKPQRSDRRSAPTRHWLRRKSRCFRPSTLRKRSAGLRAQNPSPPTA